MPEEPVAVLAVSRATDREHERPHFWPLIIVTLILMAIAVRFFGSGGTPIPAPIATGSPEYDSRIYTISYRFGVFSPTNLRIHVGDTVRFRNESQFPIHIIAQTEAGNRTPEFDSVGDVEPGSYFSYTFSSKGVFGYYNKSDTDEAGVIIVR